MSVYVCLLWLAGLGKSPQASSKETKDGVRRQLASLQKETGLTLAGFPSNYFLHIAFKDRSVSIERTSLPGSRTAEGTLSPDGSEVAFRWSTPSLPEPENEILAVVRRDGTGIREYPQIRMLATPCWSPDKSRIAVFAVVSKQGEPYRTGLLLLDLNSGVLEEIFPGGFVASECWSPDGKQLAYSARKSSERNGTDSRKNWREVYTQIGIYDIAQKSWHEISQGNEPVWSPDGKWIAVLDGDHYYAIQPSGAERKVLVQAKDLWGNLAWSPDSRFIAYAVSHVDFMNPSGVSRIHVRRLADAADDWVADKLMLGTTVRWIKIGNGVGSPR
jgi:Tol biopolymer transport system component